MRPFCGMRRCRTWMSIRRGAKRWQKLSPISSPPPQRWSGKSGRSWPRRMRTQGTAASPRRSHRNEQAQPVVSRCLERSWHAGRPAQAQRRGGEARFEGGKIDLKVRTSNSSVACATNLACRPAMSAGQGIRKVPRDLEVSVESGAANLRYLVDSYLDWAARQDIPIVEGVAVDLNTVETAPWSRLGGGCRGAFVH